MSRSPILDTRVMQVVADFVALTSSFFAYQGLRGMILQRNLPSFAFGDMLLVALFVALGWMIVFWLGGLYRDYYVRSPFEESFTILKLVFIGSLLFYLIIYVDSPDDYQRSPRYVFVLYWLLVSGCVTIGRVVVRLLQAAMRRKGTIRIRTVLLGASNRIQLLAEDIGRESEWGYEIVGCVVTDNIEVTGIQTLGTLQNLDDALRMANAEELLVTMDHTDHNELLLIVARGAEIGYKVKIVPDMYEIVSGQARTQQIYGAPLIHVNPELMQPWEEAAKRMLDIVVSTVLLAVGMPIWIIIGAMVALTSKGPVLFKQLRVGKNGQVFTMAKFRSMYVDTNRGQTWTFSNDPRVTSFGWFIRKTHLDEIPQLWNVLRGEMSLVGPRPEQPQYVEKYSQAIPYYRRRHKIRPGITGWWQVKAKSNEETVEEIVSRLRYDFFYIENMSFKLDIEILVRTVFVMLKGHGRA